MRPQVSDCSSGKVLAVDICQRWEQPCSPFEWKLDRPAVESSVQHPGVYVARALSMINNVSLGWSKTIF
jgi:hypothetical protein